jgi:hypothetical protein
LLGIVDFLWMQILEQFPTLYQLSTDHPLNPALPVEKVVVDGTSYDSLTMFFRDPATVCSANSKGTNPAGDGLWIKNKDGKFEPLITDLTAVPDATFWREGKCFPSMGVHYWAAEGAKISSVTKAADIYPVFLLYNSGALNGFGWVVSSEPVESGGKRFENPTGSDTKLFLPDGYMPSEVLSTKQLSTIHVVFNNPLTSLFCGKPKEEPLKESDCVTEVMSKCGEQCPEGTYKKEESRCGFWWKFTREKCEVVNEECIKQVRNPTTVLNVEEEEKESKIDGGEKKDKSLSAVMALIFTPVVSLLAIIVGFRRYRKYKESPHLYEDLDVSDAQTGGGIVINL